jgi:hypothetical protein
MAQAKAKGIKIGRPRLGNELRQKIAERSRKGESAYLLPELEPARQWCVLAADQMKSKPP